MEYTIVKFQNEDANKLVGIAISLNGHGFVSDERIPLIAGKSDEDYVKDAIAQARPEIDAWQAQFAVVGKKWNSQTNSFQ
jgi:hypothetical protein